MSRDRIRPDAGWVYSVKERGPEGRGLCRLCGVEVGKGRRTFCSDDCVHRWKLQTDPGYVRGLVWKRDKGVCAACKRDTDVLQSEVNRAGRYYGRPETRAMLESLGFKKTALYAGDFWQADHIQSVAEGGGGTGLENYQTLCTPCHKRKTAELVARLKERRARHARLVALFKQMNESIS